MGASRAPSTAPSRSAPTPSSFAQPNRAWRFPDHDPAVLDAFRERREASGIGAAFIHALYLLNLASENPTSTRRARRRFAGQPRRRARSAPRAPAFTGSHLGADSRDRSTAHCCGARARARSLLGRNVAADREHRRRRRHHRSLGGRAGGGRRSTRQASAARPLSRLVPPVRLGLRHHRPRRARPAAGGGRLEDRARPLRLLHINDSKAPVGSNRPARRRARRADGRAPCVSSSATRSFRSCRR